MSSVRARVSKRVSRRSALVGVAMVALPAAAAIAAGSDEAPADKPGVVGAARSNIAPAPAPRTSQESVQFASALEMALGASDPVGTVVEARFDDRLDAALAGVAERLEQTLTDASTAASRDAMWERLAECESGSWDRNGNPIPGTARWDYGISFDHGDIFEGGVNFHPGTWEAYNDSSMPGHAGEATRAQQIAVAERVLADQGWRAWPVCSRKLGYRN